MFWRVYKGNIQSEIWKVSSNRVLFKKLANKKKEILENKNDHILSKCLSLSEAVEYLNQITNVRNFQKM